MPLILEHRKQARDNKALGMNKGQRVRVYLLFQ